MSDVNDKVPPSERLSLFLTDGKNLAIFLLSIGVLIMSILITADFYFRVQTSPTYELQTDVTRYRENERAITDRALQELRDRINAETADQAAFNKAVNSQLDTLRGQVNTLLGLTTQHKPTNPTTPHE